MIASHHRVLQYTVMPALGWSLARLVERKGTAIRRRVERGKCCRARF